jgi:RHS repeat-associated protein
LFAPLREQVLAQTTTTIASTSEQYSLTLGGSLSDPNRYIGQRVFAWADGEGTSKGYAYDALSNPVDSVTGDTFSYNAEGNRLLSAALTQAGETVSYSYDAAGFATSRKGVPLSWTATGRMKSFGDDAIEWDLSGRPVSVTLGGETRDFVHFGGRISSDPFTGQLGALDLGVVTIDFVASGRLYRHFDFRNNVSFISDESGAILSHYRYSAYALDAVFGAVADATHFVGRQESSGGLMWLGARIYDPLVGRFLSPDPIFGLLNQFSYSLGNPIRYWDPDGTSPEAFTRTQRHSVLILEAAVLAVISATAAVLTSAGAPIWVAVVGAVAGAAAAYIFLGVAIADVHEAFSAGPQPGGGPCQKRCGPPKQRKEIKLAIEDAGVAQVGDLGGPGACTPVALSRVPNMGSFLVFLVPLQLFLGLMILRRRSSSRSRCGNA